MDSVLPTCHVNSVIDFNKALSAYRLGHWLIGDSIISSNIDNGNRGTVLEGDLGLSDINQIVDLNNLVDTRVAGQWLGGDGLSDVLLAVVGLVGGVVGESEASDIDGLVDW